MKIYYWIQKLDRKYFFLSGLEKSDNETRTALYKPRCPSNFFLNNFDFKIKFGTIQNDFLANDLGWYILNERYLEILKKIGHEVKFLNLPIEQIQGGEELNDFWVLVSLESLNVIDLDKSKVGWGENDIGKKYISSVMNIHLLKRVAYPMVFRDINYPYYLFVTEDFVQDVKKRKLGGSIFTEVKVDD